MANQSPAYSGYNAFLSDGVMVRMVEGQPKANIEGLIAQGQWVGSAEAQDLARLANENPPNLKTHDPKGERIDRVEFHPAYHALMRRGISLGLAGSIWTSAESEAGHRNFLRGLRFMMTSELEAGHLCPLTMTNASVAALMMAPEHLKDWMPRITSREYDATHKSPGVKKGLTIGMGMTERQGGSDVRANITSAQLGQDGTWRINGDKWFFSAPMCDAFLILAQAPGGLSCFLVPRILPDGSGNGLELQRLKPKLGNHANASSEVKFNNTFATMIGDEGQGISTILEMVTLTRLDCVLGSAGLMRAAFAEAVHHTRHRMGFGRKLIDQPIMTRVLADMALDVAAAQALSLRLAQSYDRAGKDPVEANYARLMTPAIKYWVTKMTPALIYEAMECLGGNGYVEESVMPRLYREAPLNAIWEGSGNIMCLDVLRVLKRGPQAVHSVLDRLGSELGEHSTQSIDVLRVAGDIALEDEGSARVFVEQLSITAAAAALRQALPGEFADAFVESRLGRPWRYTYGMMDARTDARSLVDAVFLA